MFEKFFGMSRTDRVRNEEVRMRAGIQKELASSADQTVLRWFGHVNRMPRRVNRMARRVLMVEVSEDGYAVDRGKTGWKV